MAKTRRMTDASGEDATVIGRGIHVKGDVTGTAPIEVWGSIEGKAGSRDLLWVRQGGRVGGEIVAANVVVEGQVEGKIAAREKLEMRSTCRIKGDVYASALAIADGSFFEGEVHMQQGGEAPKQIRFQEKRKD